MEMGNGLGITPVAVTPNTANNIGNMGTGQNTNTQGGMNMSNNMGMPSGMNGDMVRPGMGMPNANTGIPRNIPEPIGTVVPASGGAMNDIPEPIGTVVTNTVSQVRPEDLNIFTILKEAREIGTSDLHITVNTKPVTRVKGAMVRMEKYPVLTPPMTKMLCEQMMNDEQKAKIEAVGEVDFACQLEGYGRFRVNVYKQSGCYATAVRLLAESIPSFDKLNLPPAVKKFTTLRKGLVLVTGPTGSGKSTTLAAIIDTINTCRSEHIITIEDPIEYVHKHKTCIVNQREVGEDTMSFASSLRAALREDPDIILVGEMRDPETISSAITAAETGHLVFSTLHTIGASTTINRIIDSFPAGQQNQVRSQLSTVLEGVVTQRLVPKANGDGRCAALEIMFATDAIRNLIRDDKTHQITSSMQTSSGEGMQTLDKHLSDLANTGVISKQTAIINAIDKENIQSFLR